MFKRKSIYTAIAAATLASMSAVTIAQETITSTASVTVQNAFDLTEVAALNFGTIRATQNLDVDNSGSNETAATTSFANAATLNIKTDGSASTVTAATVESDTSSAITEIVAGSPAEFAIANAAPFTELKITRLADPSTTFDGYFSGDTDLVALFEMTTPASSTSVFHVVVEEEDVRFSGGGSDGDLLSSGNPQTGAAGSINIIVGGSIYMQGTAPAIVDGAYTGNFSLTVDY